MEEARGEEVCAERKRDEHDEHGHRHKRRRIVAQPPHCVRPETRGDAPRFRDGNAQLLDGGVGGRHQRVTSP